MKLIATSILLIVATCQASGAFFDKRQLQEIIIPISAETGSGQTPVLISANAEYCPDFAGFLQGFGVSLDNITMPQCAAFIDARMN